MAYHFIHEPAITIRESPGRAALAAVFLITTTIYVCAGHPSYRVVEIGESSSTEDVIDLTSHPDWPTEIDRSSAAADSPATTNRVAGREQYIDAHLTHAVAVEEDGDKESLRHVELVSGQAAQHTSDQDPVWLLGVLMND